MKPTSAGLYRHGPWAALILFMAPLLVAAVALWQQQYHHDLEKARHAAESEFRIITSVLTDALEKKNYQVIDYFLKDWGANSADTVELRVVAANGFALGQYQRLEPAQHSLELKTLIEYSYDKKVTLTTKKDLTWVYTKRENLALQLTVAALFVGAVFWFLIHTIIRRRQEAAVLKSHTEELSKSNAQLHEEILHRKAIEQNLFEEKQLIEITLHSIGDAVITTDPLGKVTYLNPVAEQLTGWSRQEARHKPLAEVFRIVEEATREPAGDPVARCLAEGRAVSLSNSVILISRHGNEYAIEDSAAPICHTDGHILGTVMVFKDTTEEKRQETILRETGAALENAIEGISRLDTEGRYAAVNTAYATMLNYTPEELVGAKWETMVHPDDLDLVQEAYQQMRANGKAEVECRALRKDGSVFYKHLVMIGAYDSQKNFIGHYGFMKDVTERQLAEAHMRQLSSAVEQAADSVIITDRDGVIQYVNPAFEQISGFGSAEAVGKKTNILKSGQHDADFYQQLWDTIERGEAYREIFTNRHKDGTLYYEQKTITPLKDRQGRISHFVSTGRDITEHMQAMEALRASEASLTQAQRIAHLGNWHRNIVTNELHWSDEVYRIFGMTPQQPSITFESFLNLIHPDDRQSVMETVNKAINDKQPYSTDYRIIRPDGTERIMHAQAEIICIDDDKADHIVGTIQDITEYRQAMIRLNYLANYDTLTDLPNRVLLQDRLNQSMLEADRRDRLVAVMFLDLDRFKIINDTLGHETGDALLKEVAGRLKTCVRAGDTISRLGGDEFTVILANVAHVDDVARVAQKIIDSFAPPFYIAGRELFMSTSIGITLYPFDDNKLDSLLRNADAAMYHAKEMGRNTFQFYTAELNRRTAKRLALETALRHALERNELLLHYQPQVNLKTGRIIGAEALLRWQHPEMGLIPPLDFIPLAEETGLILSIGEWVLRTACAQARAWHAADFRGLQMAVNLSGRQFQHRDLAQLVKKVLKETGLDPHYLDLELTESLLMHNTGETLIAMEELHAQGVAFSMDDFGTGYSSLSYLKRFPIDTLKIDKSFVHDIPEDPEDSAIAQAIIAMAHSLGIKVIAEGVETAEQLAFMRAHQCNSMQGYYFSKPVTAEAMTKLLQKDHRARRKIVPRERTNSRKQKRSG